MTMFLEPSTIPTVICQSDIVASSPYSSSAKRHETVCSTVELVALEYANNSADCRRLFVTIKANSVHPMRIYARVFQALGTHRIPRARNYLVTRCGIIKEVSRVQGRDRVGVHTQGTVAI